MYLDVCLRRAIARKRQQVVVKNTLGLKPMEIGVGMGMGMVPHWQDVPAPSPPNHIVDVMDSSVQEVRRVANTSCSGDTSGSVFVDTLTAVDWQPFSNEWP